MRGHMQVIIVGAGLAGLASAVACRDKGHDVQVLESTDRIGGRMATEIIDGCRCDVGFHVLHTAYPTLERWIDVDALRQGRWTRSPGSSIREPADRACSVTQFVPLPHSSGPYEPPGSGMVFECSHGDVEPRRAGWDRPDEGLALLDDLRSRGFSESFLDEVIIPLFRGSFSIPRSAHQRPSPASYGMRWPQVLLCFPRKALGRSRTN